MGERRVPPVRLTGGLPADPGDFLLHRRYNLTRSFLPEQREVLLDFGCGNGAQTLLFADEFAQIVGVDIEVRFLQEFQHRAQQHGLQKRLVLSRCDGSHLPLADAAADCVMSFEVLEHVPDETLVLSELHRVLRPGGTLMMSVPNRWWFFETHGAELPLLPWNRIPFFSWLPKRIHDRYARARNYRRREFISLLKDAGFEVCTSMYVTAPMDVIRWSAGQRALRATLFKPDTTRWPPLATAILAIARK